MSTLPSPIDRPQLRRLLSAVLNPASEFDAFCLDYFPEIHQRLDGGMERTSKLNILLALAEPTLILERLKDAYPDVLTSKLGAIGLTNSISQLQRRERDLAEQLAEHIRERDVLHKYGAETSSVDAAIDDAQRALRRGPHT